MRIAPIHRTNLSNGTNDVTNYQSSCRKTVSAFLLDDAIVAILNRESQGHKCPRLGGRITNYSLSKAVRPNTQLRHKWVTRAS